MADKIIYSDNPEKSFAFLQLAIELLKKLNIPADPYNYQLAYEYVSGRNQTLVDDLNKLVELAGVSGTPSEKQLRRLYKHYFVQDEAFFEAMRQEVRQIISNILQEIGKSGNQLSSYTQTLNQFIDILDGKSSPADILDESQKMIDETHSMEQSQKNIEKKMISVVAELDSLRKELKQVKEESKIDTLTGIPNRRAFDAALEHSILIARENNKPFSLLLLDVDHFKAFNDSYGHLIGDKVLRYLSASLKRTIKGNDFVARFGGEEFVIILPGTNIGGAMIVAEQIRKTVSSGKLTDKGTDTSYGKVTISVGVSQFQLSDLPNELIERADKALYQAKERGRNRIEKL